MTRTSPPGPARHRSSAVRLPRADRLWSHALLLVICGGVVPVLAVWWQDTIAGSLDTAAAWVTAAGRISGLLAAYLLLVLVALMARIPWFENRIGSDVVTRYHRALGEYAIVLACAHVVLIVVGYAMQARTGLVSESVTVVVDYTDVWLSAIGLALLLLVGVLSARAIRRRVRYETWYYGHLLVYGAIGLAFAHEFAVGADFSTSLRNRLLWIAAHVVVGLAVLLYRVMLPAWRSLRHGMRVAAVVVEGPGVVSLYISGRDLDLLDARPGQFMRWRFLDRGHWWQSHPYSLSAAPWPDGLRITVKALGDSSASLVHLRPGTRVWFEGPYGVFGRWQRHGSRILLIAGGVGITPIRALYESLPGRGEDVILVYRAMRGDDLVLHGELTEIAGERGFGLATVVGPHDGRGGDPLSAQELRRRVPDLSNREIYVCGPAGMVDSVTTSLRQAGVPAGRVHTEAFAF